MVLLFHEQDAGASHFDWMFERAGDDERRLVTFRVPVRVDLTESGEIADAERLADHRAHYLEYEGKIAGGRVTRVASGFVHALSVDGGRLEGVISWGTDPGELRTRVEGDAERDGRWRIRWQVEAISPEDAQRFGSRPGQRTKKSGMLDEAGGLAEPSDAEP